VANGVEDAKIDVCPQGIAVGDGSYNVMPMERRAGASLALAFMGRLDPTKGVDLVLDALALIPDADVTFDIYGVLPRNNDPYSARLAARIRKDPRVRLVPAVPSAASIATMRAYDMLVVPSQWLETGPLVALEAFQAGIPVIGSKLGGIGDRVTHGVDGLLLDAHDPRAWADEIRRLAADRGALAKLKAGVKPPPSMADVSSAMIRLYEELLAQREPALRAGRHSAAAPT